MNSITAQGEPNSPIRAIQNDPDVGLRSFRIVCEVNKAHMLGLLELDDATVQRIKSVLSIASSDEVLNEFMEQYS